MSGVSLKLKDSEICQGVIENNQRVMTQFYREQRIPFENAIRSKFGVNSINDFVTMDDIYHTSFTRLYQMFLKKQFIVDNDNVLYRSTGKEYSPLSGSIGNFLNSIGKNVFLEMKRIERKFHDNIGAEDEKNAGEGGDEQLRSLPGEESTFGEQDGGEKSDIIDEDPEIVNEKELDAILVWRVVKQMKEPCNSILDAFLTKNITKKKDSDIAMELGFKNSDVVKSQRTRCYKKFESAFIELKRKLVE